MHPFIPKRSNVQRVNNYWSCMVIRSTSASIRNAGLEYVLTYFEDPGVVLPQSVTSWVAQKQLPEFLHKLYTATLEYAREKKSQQQQQKHHDEKLVRFIEFGDLLIQPFSHFNLIFNFYILRPNVWTIFEIPAMNIHRNRKSLFRNTKKMMMLKMATTMMMTNLIILIKIKIRTIFIVETMMWTPNLILMRVRDFFKLFFE